MYLVEFHPPIPEHQQILFGCLGLGTGGKPHTTGDAALNILQREVGGMQNLPDAKRGRHLCGVQSRKSKHQHLSLSTVNRGRL